MHAAWLCIALAACTEGASSDPGRSALFQVYGDDAQFRPGGFPADEGGPAAVELLGTSIVTIGRARASLDGALASDARGFVLGVEGIDGTWVMPAQVPDLDSPTSPGAHAQAGFAYEFPIGPFRYLLAASDADGRFGPPVALDGVAEPEDPPTGELVVELAWIGRADLDIHVVEPGINGGEAFTDHPTTFEPPIGEPQPPGEFAKHGILDHDGNRECSLQAHPTEHVIWTMPPPSGEYIVRVDTPDLCGAPAAAWVVSAFRNGELIGSVRGTSTPDDVLEPRGRGAGVLALKFSL